MRLSLAAAVRILLDEDAWETQVRVDVSEMQLLLLRRPGALALWLEVWPEAGPSGDLRERCSALGLRRRRFQGGGRTYGVELDPEITASALATRVDRILAGLQKGGDAGIVSTAVSVAVQRQAPPANPLLLEAMRAAASHQDSGTRQRLYAALVNATLLVPIEPQTAELAEHEQRPLKLAEDTWVAFSHWDALRQWSPDGHPAAFVHGTELFAHVAAGAAGVRINPGGVVGGVLYPGEVRMMAEAVRGYIHRRSN